MQTYSDPSREGDAQALPDVEVWQDAIAEVYCGRYGCFDVTRGGIEADPAHVYCPSCESDKQTSVRATNRTGWFWQSCFPGRLPDGEPNGPFATAAEAKADAQAGNE